MGLKRAGAGSMVGAVAFLAVAASPSAAQTRDRCELGRLVCDVLDSLPGGAAPDPAPSHHRSAPPEPRPRRPAPRHHAAPPAERLPVTDRVPLRPPPHYQGQLPDISHQMPQVGPGPARSPVALTFAADPEGGGIPPFPVAAASCIIGALATVHLSVLARRLHRRG